jgi:uncharacterized membrane protein
VVQTVRRTRPASRQPDAASLRHPDVVLGALALLTVVGFVLRVTQIDQSIVADEVFTYQDIVHRSFGAVLTTVHAGGENSPPLYFLLAWASAKLGDPTVWIRLPSLVLGTATIPVVYLLGRETVGRLAGLIGAGIMALTPFAVYYGVEARPYATMTFFVALSTLALVRAVGTRSRWWWLAYALAAVAAAYSHYTAIFVLVVQGFWSLWAARDRLREPLLANGLAALLYLPWLPHLRGKELAVIGRLYPLTFRTVVKDLLRPIPGHPGARLTQIPTIPGLVVVGLIALGGVIAVANRWRAAGYPRPASTVTLLVILAAATPIGLLAYSLAVTDLWLPRGLSASMPAAALILGALVAALPRRAMILAAALLAAVLLFGTIRSYGSAYTRGPFRTIASFLDQHAGRQNPVVIVSVAGIPAVRAELKDPHKIVSLKGFWRSFPPGGRGYMVLDDTVGRIVHITGAPPAGFRLTSHTHYAGAFATELFSYRRAG